MQTDLLATVVTRLRAPSQLIELLNRAAAVLYPIDPASSNHLRDSVARWRLTFGDLACVEYEHGELPPNPSLREITDLLFTAYPKMAKEIRVVLTKADQVLGRERFLELLNEIRILP
jgi:hypothetical protein